MADIVSYISGMHKFRNNILSALRERGSAASNPVTMSIACIVIARDRMLNKLIENR